MHSEDILLPHGGPTSAVAALGAPRTTRKAQSEAVVAATWAASWVSLLKPPLRKTGPNPKKGWKIMGKIWEMMDFTLQMGKSMKKCAHASLKSYGYMSSMLNLNGCFTRFCMGPQLCGTVPNKS